MAVNLATDIKPISYIKTNAANMIKYINASNSAKIDLKEIIGFNKTFGTSIDKRHAVCEK
jgi:hypothetical protein